MLPKRQCRPSTVEMAENNLCPDRFTDEHKIQMDLNSNDDRQMMILADDQDPKDLPTADNHFLSGVQSWVNKSSETRNTMHRLMHVISDTLEGEKLINNINRILNIPIYFSY